MYTILEDHLKDLPGMYAEATGGLTHYYFAILNIISKTEMVWAQNKINRTCKDDPTGHCTRREKERQTEKEMGRQRNGMDRIKVG